MKKESDATWTDIIVKGKNKMPAYDNKITDAEVKMSAYIRTLAKSVHRCAWETRHQPSCSARGPRLSFAGARLSCSGTSGDPSEKARTLGP